MGPRAAESFELTFLKHPEQLGLELQRQVADFVEEDRPAVGEFEASGPARDGSGESAFFVAEEFAFDEFGQPLKLFVKNSLQ